MNGDQFRDNEGSQQRNSSRLGLKLSQRTETGRSYCFRIFSSALFKSSPCRFTALPAGTVDAFVDQVSPVRLMVDEQTYWFAQCLALSAEASKFDRDR